MKKLQIGCAAMTLVVLFLAKAPRLQSKSNSAPSTPSNHSLTADQIAVYRAVISEYLRNSPGKLNISRLTDAMGQVEPSLNQECIRGIDLEKANPTPAIHELDSLAESNSQLMLVDRNEQQQQVERNDPQNLLDRASDNHERVTENKLNDSVKRAFETGLLHCQKSFLINSIDTRSWRTALFVAGFAEAVAR